MNRSRYAEKPALDLCEEAIYVMRSAPLSALVTYYLGSIPFILGFLYFWADASSAANAREHYGNAALAVAVLYVWMTACHARYTQLLRDRLAGVVSEPLRMRGWLLLLSSQAAVQPTKLIALPVAILVLLPLPGVFAFYHTASVADPSVARREAFDSGRSNWTFLAIYGLLSVVVFVNLAIAMMGLPYLLKTFLGIDTELTHSVFGLLNSTFIAAVAGASYLIVNPFAKAFYTVRHFHYESKTTGADLMVRLRTSVAPLAMILVLACMPLRGQPALLPQQLDQSINRVLAQPEFSWRLPRQSSKPDAHESWFVHGTRAFLTSARNGFRSAVNWLSDLLDWLADRFTRKLPGVPEVQRARPPAAQLRALMLVLLAILTAVVSFLLWRLLARQQTASVPAHAGTGVTPVDLRSDDIDAAQQPLESWLEMAREYMERREHRLALRALYLAGLAGLAGQSLIVLERSKSDREYARELKRRARQRPDIVRAFTSTLALFERGWYGMYDVDRATLVEVEANLDRMTTRNAG